MPDRLFASSEDERGGHRVTSSQCKEITMNRKKLRRWLLVGLFAASLGLPIVRVAADVSAGRTSPRNPPRTTTFTIKSPTPPAAARGEVAAVKRYCQNLTIICRAGHQSACSWHTSPETTGPAVAEWNDYRSSRLRYRFLTGENQTAPDCDHYGAPMHTKMPPPQAIFRPLFHGGAR